MPNARNSGLAEGQRVSNKKSPTPSECQQVANDLTNLWNVRIAEAMERKFCNLNCGALITLIAQLAFFLILGVRYAYVFFERRNSEDWKFNGTEGAVSAKRLAIKGNEITFIVSIIFTLLTILALIGYLTKRRKLFMLFIGQNLGFITAFVYVSICGEAWMNRYFVCVAAAFLVLCFGCIHYVGGYCLALRQKKLSEHIQDKLSSTNHLNQAITIQQGDQTEVNGKEYCALPSSAIALSSLGAPDDTVKKGTKISIGNLPIRQDCCRLEDTLKWDESSKKHRICCVHTKKVATVVCIVTLTMTLAIYIACGAGTDDIPKELQNNETLLNSNSTDQMFTALRGKYQKFTPAEMRRTLGPFFFLQFSFLIAAFYGVLKEKIIFVLPFLSNLFFLLYFCIVVKITFVVCYTELSTVIPGKKLALFYTCTTSVLIVAKIGSVLIWKYVGYLIDKRMHKQMRGILEKTHHVFEGKV